MLSAPGAAMLNSKLFTCRLDGSFPDLYERWWDGDEWIWVDHGRPLGIAVTGSPGAPMLDSKLFVIVSDGSLWELNWRADLGRWAWEEHGRPMDRRITDGPGAEMMNRKFFVTAEEGHLWERDWRTDLGRWAWEDHGAPTGTTVSTAPGAAMMDAKLFVGTANGQLFERFWDGAQWVWVDHGAPPGTTVATAPGAAMMDTKLFVGASNGHLFERFWDGAQWVWVDHGAPPGTTVSTAPGAAMMDAKLFVGAANGHLFERFWDGTQWAWVDHGAPPGTTVSTAPGAAMMDTKLFLGAANGHLFERFWDGTQWVWVDHGTARHDSSQHVVGAPGPEPKLTIAVMGDGFAESDLGTYERIVKEQVLRALASDELSTHQAALRVVRIDLVSVESGVRERRYDSHGNITSDIYRPSRLGVIPNNDWKRCWFDESPYTTSRIDKLRRRFAPDADHIIVMVNSNTWGGCSSVGRGVASFTLAGGWVVIAHECGHNLFELDDEYVNEDLTFTGTSAYANTTEGLANWTNLKWASLVQAGAALPTDAAHLAAGWSSRTSVGAFEGAGGHYSHGLFRPVLECRMNQNDPPWCPVCSRKIAQDLAVFV
jgi:hypothetical protein